VTTAELRAARIFLGIVLLLVTLGGTLLVAFLVTLVVGGPSGTILLGLLAVYGCMCRVELACVRASTSGAPTAARPDPAPPVAG
jgi:hypothetical protein